MSRTRIRMKGTGHVYRVPEDMYPFAAANMVGNGRAEWIEDEPTVKQKVVETAAKVMTGARTAARHAFPFTDQNRFFAKR